MSKQTYTISELSDIVIKNLNAIASFEGKEFSQITEEQYQMLVGGEIGKRLKDESSKKFKEAAIIFQKHVKKCENCQNLIRLSEQLLKLAVNHSQEGKK